ncbi:MAG: dinitrogenase iron-molybdenum cofactor biosynthesis protein [Anaerolineales bacterium]|nr:dinitrogenase iron-molybdenum cofactor biosynthesis protein [Anaerolineales bacterium]
MKIAAITDNGKTISQHFGRASHYMVVTIADGKITNREMREKMGHAQFQGELHEEHHHEEGGQHGYGAAADHKHGRMAETITDCEAVLCRGMGMGAYENMKSRNIRPVVTDIADIDEAVLAYANGQLVDHIEKLH